MVARIVMETGHLKDVTNAIRKFLESQVLLPIFPWPKSNLESPSTVKEGLGTSFWNRGSVVLTVIIIIIISSISGTGSSNGSTSSNVVIAFIGFRQDTQLSLQRQ